MPRLHALLAGVFDYAGLFPPATLSLDRAVAEYAALRAGPDAWMLGRMLVPVARLDALASQCSAFASADIRLSLITTAQATDDQALAARWNADARRSGAPLADTVELPTPTLDAIRVARAWGARGFEVFCEVPLGPDLPVVLDAVARAGLHAKVRLASVGRGVTPADVAEFLCGCVARGVVAKATAGLHHALSAGLSTASPAADRQPHLGFLNLLIAAGVAEGAGRAAAQSAEVCATVEHLLVLDAPPTWSGHSQVEWGDSRGPIVEGPIDQFAVAARALVRSIGTCSFDEPVADARRTGLLRG